MMSKDIKIDDDDDGSRRNHNRTEIEEEEEEERRGHQREIDGSIIKMTRESAHQSTAEVTRAR